MYDTIIADLRALLTKSLAVDQASLIQQLNDLELVRAPLLTAVCAAHRQLQQERDRLRHPKDKDLTDFDRQTMLQAAVADLQHDYDLLNGLAELANDRQTILKLLLVASGVVTAAGVA